MKRILTAFLFILISAVNTIADDTIQGKYCYTHGDNESLVAAKELTRTLAIRNAIENYQTYVVATSGIKNFTLTNDIVMTLSSGYLKNIKSTGDSISGRTVCESVTASVNPEEIGATIKRESLSRSRQIEEKGVDNNGTMKILRTFRVKDSLYVVYEILKADPQRKAFTTRPPPSVYTISVLCLMDDGGHIYAANDSVEYYQHMRDVAAGVVGTLEFKGIPAKTASYKAFLYK